MQPSKQIDWNIAVNIEPEKPKRRGTVKKRIRRKLYRRNKARIYRTS